MNHSPTGKPPAPQVGAAPVGGLAPAGTGHGPAAVIREMARDLMRQRRIRPQEAGRIEAALRDHDWPAVRALIDAALSHRPDAASSAAATSSMVAASTKPGAGSGRTDAAGVAASGPGGEPGDAHAADGAAATIEGLLRLVLRLCEAMPRLTGNDDAFVERLDPIRALLLLRLTPDRLRAIDERIGALIEQQAQVQQDMRHARSSLRDMLAFVVQQLGVVGDSATRFQQRVSAYQEELAGPPDAGMLARVAGGLVADTRAVVQEIEQSRSELAEARRKVESYELRVRSLEHELAETARMVQNDALTHVLNRRGLDEVFRVEVSRASRYRVPLTVVMIDLDDFKAVNDTLGHAGGDRALIHFVTTAQASLRSTEVLARTGGEEFVVVFPATGVDASVDAMRRLQRELARSPFTFEGDTRVLSFSGGAAQWQEGESLADLLRRADAAMYTVKRAGKDSVAVAAPA